MSGGGGIDAERVKREARERWGAAATVRLKWHERRAAFNRPETDAILVAAGIRPGMQVVDLASGAGEPGLRAAELIGTAGHVTCTDLAPPMLDAAEDLARRAGLGNVSFQSADMEALPFPDQRFDAVTCRLGLMYCPRPEVALGEAYRVLKSGGRAAFLTLGPLDENPFMTTPITPLQKRVQLPPPPPGTPDVFRYVRPEALAAELRSAGFRDVEAELFRFQICWPDSADDLLAYQREFHGLWQPLAQRIPAGQYEVVLAEVLAGFRRYQDGQQFVFPAASVVASGMR